MATNFKNYLTANIGITPTVVYNPTTVGIQSTIIGFILANTTTVPVTITVTLTSGATTVNIIKNATITNGNSLDLANTGGRIVLAQNDSISVVSSAATSIDVTISTVEVV